MRKGLTDLIFRFIFRTVNSGPKTFRIRDRHLSSVHILYLRISLHNNCYCRLLYTMNILCRCLIILYGTFQFLIIIYFFKSKAYNKVKKKSYVSIRVLLLYVFKSIDLKYQSRYQTFKIIFIRFLFQTLITFTRIWICITFGS